MRRGLFVALCLLAPFVRADDYRIAAAELAITDSNVTITATLPAMRRAEGVYLTVAGASYLPSGFSDGRLTFPTITIAASGTHAIRLMRGEMPLATSSIRVIPGWFTLLPPALTIAVALLFRSVIPALFAGIFIGAWGVTGFTPGGLVRALGSIFETYIRDALLVPDHATVILFTLMTSGMIGILARNGGMSGLVRLLTRWTYTPRRGMLCSTGLGFAIFFDDYATTLLVGKTMRPITDRLRISREKLAYLVDSTAAPLACIAFITTWVGFQLSLIGGSVAGLPELNLSASSILISAIGYGFYPVLALVFVVMVALGGRDFGPMYAAERAAREREEAVLPGEDAAAEHGDSRSGKDIPHRAINFFVPILVLVATLLGGLAHTGEGDSIREIVGSADSFRALMWASFAGALTAGAMSLAQRIFNLEETVQAWYSGVETMLYPMIILLLAWSLSAITQELRTADFMVSIMGDGVMTGLLPAVVFVFAAVIAFATGSSFSTMGIMIPLVIPLVWGLLQSNGQADPDHYFIVCSSVSSVMAGAVWGDHCSPISDTTVLSSMSSDCGLIEHVRTQLPYAMSVAVVAIAFGIIPSGLGVPVWLCFALSIAALWILLRLLGKRTDNEVLR